MAQSVEQILQAELGSLVMQLSIKAHQLQVANEKIAELEAQLPKKVEGKK